MKFLNQIKNANFPMDQEGRTYHVGLKAGDAANRILMVGEPGRALLLRSKLDNPNCFEYHSHRGFLTFTGHFKNKPVSIVSIGMGLAMADFAVRELRAIIEGPMAIIRLGTCGTPNSEVPLGSVAIARESFAITTNYDAYHKDRSLKKFVFSMPVGADTILNNNLKSHLDQKVPSPFRVVSGIDATADSFYSSQGRSHHMLLDDNDDLLAEIMSTHKDTVSLQMETLQIFHLAKIGRDIRAAAAAIVVAQRHNNEFLAKDELKLLESHAGEACLWALAESEI